MLLRSCSRLLSGTPRGLDASQLVRKLVPEAKRSPPPDAVPSIGFGKYFSDHLLECDWQEGTGCVIGDSGFFFFFFFSFF
jgi:hypothetical protein